MFLLYLLLFLGGLLVGLIKWHVEKENETFKILSRKTVTTLFVVSFVVLMIGYLLAYISLVRIGLYLLIPILAMFLVRKTMLFIRADRRNDCG